MFFCFLYHSDVLQCLCNCFFFIRWALWLPGILRFWLIIIFTLNDAVFLLYLSDIKTADLQAAVFQNIILDLPIGCQTSFRLCSPCLPRKLHIMLVQDAKAMDIPGLPGFFLAAEMQYRRVLHDLRHIISAAAAQHIIAVITGIVVPDRIFQRQNPLAVQGV